MRWKLEDGVILIGFVFTVLRVGVLGMRVEGENPIPLAAGLGNISGLQVRAGAPGGSVRPMFGAMEPPAAVVVPEMVVLTGSLLTVR